jgi:hypothetical protein
MSKKMAVNSHFKRYLQRGFRYGAAYAALAEWPPKRAVSRVGESCRAMAQLAVGFSGRFSRRSLRQLSIDQEPPFRNGSFFPKQSSVSFQPNDCFAADIDIWGSSY